MDTILSSREAYSFAGLSQNISLAYFSGGGITNLDCFITYIVDLNGIVNRVIVF